jgi:hypothetical protein
LPGQTHCWPRAAELRPRRIRSGRTGCSTALLNGTKTEYQRLKSRKKTVGIRTRRKNEDEKYIYYIYLFFLSSKDLIYLFVIFNFWIVCSVALCVACVRERKYNSYINQEKNLEMRKLFAKWGWNGSWTIDTKIQFLWTNLNCVSLHSDASHFWVELKACTSSYRCLIRSSSLPYAFNGWNYQMKLF